MKCCQSICETVLSKQEDWKTGKTKIFLKVPRHISTAFVATASLDQITEYIHL